MRITPYQTKVIKEKVAEIFGEGSKVYLFGLRVDDSKKGGDIDLFVSVNEEIEEAISKWMKLNGALLMAFGEQKIDIVFHAPNYEFSPIHQIALSEGILL